MSINRQMNYYDYAKTLSAEGVMTALIGGGAGPEPEQHEYVDLGLSVKWATCNIGASSPEETGLYFAWGETQGYTSGQVGTDKYFAWDGDNADYKYGTYDDSDNQNWGMEKYNKNDGKTVLDTTDDAATANWGSGWRMPTKEEFEELTANTEYEWTEIDGVQGGKFTSTVSGYTDKFLFFPAVGDSEDGEVYGVGDYGNYWSVSLNDKCVFSAWELDFEGGDCGVNGDNRCYGYSVRPVRF
jgi:uncharacterized protein (TIGR02145 family)